MPMASVLHGTHGSSYMYVYMNVMYPLRVFGCYEALDGGGLEEALVDFTGGIAETIELQTDEIKGDEAKRAELYEVLKKAIGCKSLMAAAIPVSTEPHLYW